MEAEIIGFEKQFVEVADEKDKNKAKTVPIAILTLRSDLPDSLPVGKIVELSVVKEKEKPEETEEEEK